MCLFIMPPKVNDKCLCGSDKKYKKCCLGKNIAALDEHNYVHPNSIHQLHIRNVIQQYAAASVKARGREGDPYCRVCGDTEDLCKILVIPTQAGNINLCEDCYRIQKSM